MAWGNEVLAVTMNDPPVISRIHMVKGKNQLSLIVPKPPHIAVAHILLAPNTQRNKLYKKKPKTKSNQNNNNKIF